MDERIVELEIKIAYQDRVISDLDEVVQTFAKRVEILERELAELKRSTIATEVGPPDEPPPHY